jgi:hypothetical protein
MSRCQSDADDRLGPIGVSIVQLCDGFPTDLGRSLHNSISRERISTNFRSNAASLASTPPPSINDGCVGKRHHGLHHARLCTEFAR